MHPVARSQGIATESVGEDLIIYDLERDRAHRLNPTAAHVWRHADGQRGVAELAEVLRRDLDPAADENLVWCSLDRLAGAQLLQNTPPRPADAARASRREFVRKVGAVGALSLLLPLVTSIAAPTRAAAQSGPATCNTNSSSQSESSSATNTNSSSQSASGTESASACDSTCPSTSGCTSNSLTTSNTNTASASASGSNSNTGSNSN
jgi:hypothetical protein